MRRAVHLIFWLGVAFDQAQAFKWYKRAAERCEVRKHRPASVIATIMVGASMSTAQAFKLLKRAADAFFARRC
jgi:hypothetical protein